MRERIKGLCSKISTFELFFWIVRLLVSILTNISDHVTYVVMHKEGQAYHIYYEVHKAICFISAFPRKASHLLAHLVCFK